MPTYDYKCKQCECVSEYFLTITQSEKAQKCKNCESLETYKIITGCNFILKGDDFPGKNLKIKRQMAQNRERVGYKQEIKKREEIPKLVPNVGGEEVKNWGEAKSLAQDKNMDTSGYDKRIQQEVADTKKIVKP